MSQQNNVAVSIPAAELSNIQALIGQLKTALQPYTIHLTAEDRAAMLKLGDKSVAFVNKVNDYAQSHPEFVPSFLDVPAMQVDSKALNQLTPLYNALQELTNAVNDTLSLSGSEAFMGALMYYNNVKQADKNGIERADLVYNDLKQRFQVRPLKKEAVKPSEAGN